MVRKHKVQRHKKKLSWLQRLSPLILTLILISVGTFIFLVNFFANKTPASAQQMPNVCQKVIIPAYFYPNPSTLWDQAIAKAPTVSMMIVDPANGPGTTTDSNYVSIIAKARSNNVKLFGYVTSSYTNRTTQSIKTEIDKWSSMYGITDIFIDEATSDAAHIPFYQELYTYIKTKSPTSTIIINPGTTVDEGYMAVADIISIYEGNPDLYASFQLPQWVYNYPSTRFLHLVYAVPNSQSMQQVLEKTRSLKAGYVYITNDTLTPGQPWDTLPSYLDDEISVLNAVCQGEATITPVPSTVISPTFIPTRTPTPTKRVPTPTSTPIPDTTVPYLEITFPQNNTVVKRNSTVTIRATASDNIKVKQVLFYLGRNQICNDKSAAYQCKWNVPSQRNRLYTIMVKAVDTANNSASQTINVVSSP